MTPYRNRDDAGIALLTSLIAIATLTILGLGMITTGRISLMISGNGIESVEAGYLAESGSTHARALIVPMGSDFTTLLQLGDGTGCTGDELSTATPNPIPSSGYTLGAGSYVVSICDDNDGDSDPSADSNGVIRVISVGTGPTGGTATIELTLGTSDVPAILVDGNLRINAGTTVTGTAGAVHSNGDLHLNGSSACAQMHFSTAGSIVSPPPLGSTGAACNETGGGMDVRPGEPLVSTPTVDFPALKASVDYILKDNGTIYNVATTATTGPFGGWSWSGPKWEIDGLVNGSYYAENTAININNINGTASFVADGYIEVSGNPDNLSPDLTIGGVAYAMVAAYDLKLNGNAATTNIEGVFFANHQIDISGNPNISGRSSQPTWPTRPSRPMETTSSNLAAAVWYSAGIQPSLTTLVVA